MTWLKWTYFVELLSVEGLADGVGVGGIGGDTAFGQECTEVGGT